MKTEGRPQEIIESIVRRNEAENKTDTIDFIFLSWLWEDFKQLKQDLDFQKFLLECEKGSRIDSTGKPFVMCREDDYRDLIQIFGWVLRACEEVGTPCDSTTHRAKEMLQKMRIPELEEETIEGSDQFIVSSPGTF